MKRVRFTPAMIVGLCVIIAGIIWFAFIYMSNGLILAFITLVIILPIGGVIYASGYNKRFRETRFKLVKAAEKSTFGQKNFNPDYVFDLYDYRQLAYDKAKGECYITPIFKELDKIKINSNDFFDISDIEKIRPYSSLKHNYKGRGIGISGITAYKVKDDPKITELGFDICLKGMLGLSKRIEFLEEDLEPDSQEYKKLYKRRDVIMNELSVLREIYEDKKAIDE